MIAQNEVARLVIDGRPATPTEMRRVFGSIPVAVVARPAVEIDEEYEAWKREMGLDRPMTAQEIEEIARYELAYIA